MRQRLILGAPGTGVRLWLFLGDRSEKKVPQLSLVRPFMLLLGLVVMGCHSIGGSTASNDGGWCAGNEKSCNENCVAQDDPQYGCSAAGCNPCAIANGSAGCQGGACVVASRQSGYADCDGDASNGCETNIETAQHCGGCATSCSGNQPFCASQGAGYACSPDCAGQTPDLCGTSCVNKQTDVHNCGVCTTDCTQLPGVNKSLVSCVNGACKLAGACLPNRGDCTASPGCETSLTTAAHCGSCTTACSGATPACESNGSTYSCASGCSGQTPSLCGSDCVDEQTDRYHCGDCATDCTALAHVDASNVTCAAGACNLVGACLPNWGDCTADPGCETDLTTATHCGHCATSGSGSTPVCAASGGQYSCTSGCSGSTPDLCGTTCVNKQTDPNHCGNCANACTQPAHSTATCTTGTCGFTCAANYHSCSGACVSNSSISSCGTSCAACIPPTHSTATCDGTSCGFTCNASYLSCGGACVICNTPPTPTCVDPTAVSSYSATGVCSSGQCSYPVFPLACPYGCASGACQASPCPGGSGVVTVPGTYATIDAALYALAPTGGTICIAAGTYSENLSTNFTGKLMIIGSGATKTVVSGWVQFSSQTTLMADLAVTQGVTFWNNGLNYFGIAGASISGGITDGEPGILRVSNSLLRGDSIDGAVSGGTYGAGAAPSVVLDRVDAAGTAKAAIDIFGVWAAVPAASIQQLYSRLCRRD